MTAKTLFNYQSFCTTQTFLKNHNIIIWCTKLMQSNADKHVNIDVAMRKKGLGWILQKLAGDRQAKPQLVTMEVDKRPEVPKMAMVSHKFFVSIVIVAFITDGIIPAQILSYPHPCPCIPCMQL
jgi:hypothetical protein